MKGSTISRLILSAFIALIVPASALADAALSVSSPSSLPQGTTFTVDVNISGAVNLYDFQLDLIFNPNVLQATGITEGTFLSGGDPRTNPTIFLAGTIDNVGGSITSNADSLEGDASGMSGNGTLIEFAFTALASGTSVLTIQNEILQDPAGPLTGAVMSDTTTPGSVNVIGGGPVPAPEPSSLAFLVSAVGAFGLFVMLKRV